MPYFDSRAGSGVLERKMKIEAGFDTIEDFLLPLEAQLVMDGNDPALEISTKPVDGEYNSPNVFYAHVSTAGVISIAKGEFSIKPFRLGNKNGQVRSSMEHYPLGYKLSLEGEGKGFVEIEIIHQGTRVGYFVAEPSFSNE